MKQFIAYAQKLLLGRTQGLLLAGLIIIALCTVGFIHAKKTVHIAADGQTYKVVTFQASPESVLAEAGVYLNTYDEIRLSKPKLTNDCTITVLRAVPVFIVTQEEHKVLITAKPTVEEILTSQGYTAPNWKSVLEPATVVTAGMELRVAAVTEQQVEVEETIAYPLIRQADPKIQAGLEQVEQSGQDGSKRVTYQVRYEDGQEVARTVVNETVIKEPIPAQIRSGSRGTDASRGLGLRFSRMITMEATAYLPSDGEGHGITYSGIPARYGVVAVDPRVIPLGTRVYVPGYGVALAADTGGAIKGNRIDLCMEVARDAWNFGRRMVEVYILE